MCARERKMERACTRDDERGKDREREMKGGWR